MEAMESKIPPFFVGLAVGAVLTFILGGAYAYHVGKMEVRKEAVKRGSGRFVASSDGEEIEFEWVPAPTARV